MSADESMLRRLDELDRKVRVLERRRVSGWLAALALGVLGGWLGRLIAEPPSAHAQLGGPQDLVARSLKIVNERGNALIHLTYDQFHGIARFSNAEGKVLISLDGDADGGFVRINGPEGLERAFLGVGDRKGGGLLYFRNGDGKGTPIAVGVNARGGYMTFNNQSLNKRTFWIGNDDDDAGSIHLYDRQANVRCDFGANKEGGMVNLFGSKQNKSHVYLGTGSFNLGGLLLLRNDEGKVRAEMGQGRNGGYVFLNGNKNDQPHIGIATSEDQRGGYFQIRNNTGKIQVELGIDNQGTGYIDAVEKK